MLKKIICLVLTIILFLINTNIIYALEVYENDLYNIYYNNIKSELDYKVAKVKEGDRIFYDLEGITNILKSKGGTSTKVYKIDSNEIKNSITKLSSELGNEKETNDLKDITNDYSNIKENDTIAIITKLNNNLIYGITNKIGTKEFLPFAIIKYDIYVDESENIDSEQYETILFAKVNIGSDVESYIDNNKIYYPIRFISLLLGADINLEKLDESGKDKTNVLIDFDISTNYDVEYIYSSEEDKKNKTLSKNECLNINVTVNETEETVNKFIYNLDDTSLKLVQKKDLKDFISEDKLETFSDKVNTISICNGGDKKNIKDIYFDAFIGTEDKNFLPTNLTIKGEEIVIKNTENVTINTYNEAKIKKIALKKVDDTELTFDKEFSLDTEKYQTTEILSSSHENVYYTIEFEDGNTEKGYVYLKPKQKETKIQIDKYTFSILRNEKDSITKIKTVKFKRPSDSVWNELKVNSEGKYVIEGTYNEYELMIEPFKETSNITVTSGTVTKDGNAYKIVPGTNIQSFEVVAEDGNKQEYSITFDDSNVKETITTLEVYQGDTKLEIKGPDENNQYTVEEFDRTKGEIINFKGKTSTGRDIDEKNFTPNEDNKNTGTLTLKNNTYTVLFKEKENVPKEENTEKETITSIEIYQGETKLEVTGPDENNQYTVEEFNKSKGEAVNIKYKTSKGREFDEKGFIPNSDNKNTGTLTLENNTYTVLFKEIKPQKFIFVGDSRTVHINTYVGNPDNVYFVAKGSMGLDWFKSTAISQVNNIINSSNESYYIFINLGVNHGINGTKAVQTQVDGYLNKLKELSNGEWKNQKIVYVSVLPNALNAQTTVKNEGIIDFNNKIKAGLENTNMKYCDALNGIGYENFTFTTDGFHYPKDTSIKIYNYIMDNCQL